ncbi:fluoride efflux transporter FluC [Sporosarcina limicola]|uniref:Fluoride-specific ion channel FluC n=1 Tax=Sporosarcina limicola TaxID=34101 RepID=A0A927R6Y8_9BACL|nr:CrcB family protein [Sporosarcina limicola]MBE1555434.1 CrcB protein [Sporosarcina limicola]
MKKVVWIGLTGAAGAILRISVGQLMYSESDFPTMTLTINIIGTFLLCLIVTGVFREIGADKKTEEVITTGFLGSFTTFSALSMETVMLVENGQYFIASFYVVSSIIGGLAAGVFGFHLGKKKVCA